MDLHLQLQYREQSYLFGDSPPFPFPLSVSTPVIATCNFEIIIITITIPILQSKYSQNSESEAQYTDKSTRLLVTRELIACGIIDS